MTLWHANVVLSVLGLCFTASGLYAEGRHRTACPLFGGVNTEGSIYNAAGNLVNSYMAQDGLPSDAVQHLPQNSVREALLLEAIQIIVMERCPQVNKTDLPRIFADFLGACRRSTARNCDKKGFYRRLDGSCHRQRQLQGRAGVCMPSLIEPSFNDGISLFRTSRQRRHVELPNPVILSTLAEQLEARTADRASVLLRHFVQCVSRDTVEIALLDNGRGPATCGDQDLPSHFSTTFCHEGLPCVSWKRALPCNTCTMSARRPQNLQTSHLDLSNIYGMDGTRTHHGAYLMSAGGAHGDDNLIEVLFRRNHNHWVNILRRSNRGWNMRKIFREARRLNIAEYQRITFAELLPEILGHEAWSFWQLYSKDEQHSKHVPEMDSATNIEVAVLFGQFWLQSFDRFELSDKQVLSRSNLNTTSDFLRDRQTLLKALLSARWDAHIDHCLKKKLESFDMKSLQDTAFFPSDVFRSRDVGVAPYVEYLRRCFGRTVSTFEHLGEFMSDYNWNLLRKYYMSVDDIDLVVGAAAEAVPDDAIVGPTAACIFGEHFFKMRFGDPFFYEHFDAAKRSSLPDVYFSKDQIEEIKKTSLKLLLCRNLAGWTGVVPSEVFATKMTKDKDFLHVPSPEFDFCLDYKRTIDYTLLRPAFNKGYAPLRH